MSKVRLTSGRQVGGADEVVQHVAHGDRLDPVVEPLRRDHHRQPGREVAQHLERRRSRAEDDRRLQHRGRDAAREEDLPDLHPRREVVAQLALRRVEPGEVDDPPDARLLRRSTERAGQLAVALDEAALAVHRVQEVVGDVDVGEGLGEGLRRGRVTLDDLDPVAPPPVGHLGVVTGEGAHGPPLVEEAGDESRPDVAGDTGDEGAAGLVHRRSRVVLSCAAVRSPRRSSSGFSRGVASLATPAKVNVGGVDDGRPRRPVGRHGDGVVARRGVVAPDDDEGQARRPTRRCTRARRCFPRTPRRCGRRSRARRPRTPARTTPSRHPTASCAGSRAGTRTPAPAVRWSRRCARWSSSRPPRAGRGGGRGGYGGEEPRRCHRRRTAAARDGRRRVPTTTVTGDPRASAPPARQ